MIVTPLKTQRISAGRISLVALLDKAITSVKDRDVLAVTSKVVSLCENNVTPIDASSLDELVKQESDLYFSEGIGKNGHHFSIAKNTLISLTGIDESNGDGNYVLWPKDPQKSANGIREYLLKRFNLKEVGVIITDSTCHPMRRGTTGISIAHSGFLAIEDYIGKPDLFGRPFKVTTADVNGGLAAAAVLLMGEGSEQTPLCLLSDLPFVTFQRRNPTHDEIKNAYIDLQDDLFEPFINAVKWQKGDSGRRNKAGKI